MKQTLLFIASFLLFINSIAQTHTIEIHPNGRVASILMTPAEYSSWISNDDFNNLIFAYSLKDFQLPLNFCQRHICGIKYLLIELHF